METSTIRHNMKMTTHYDTLGVCKEATDVDIKRCFRRLSLELHPDRNVGTETRYKQVVEAYEILGDAEKRRLYDISLKEDNMTRTLVTTKHRPTHMTDGHEINHKYKNRDFDNRGYNYDYDGLVDNDSYYDPHSFNENTMRGHYDYNYARRQHNVSSCIKSQALEDIQHTVGISLEESFTGVSVPINIIRKVNGVKEEVTLYVDIPAGTDNGEIVVMEGKGHIDAKMRMRSHIRVKVVIDNHDLFRRDALNIVCSMEVTLKEALCGFKKEITHLDGKVYLVGSEQGKVISQGGRRVIPNKGFRRGNTIGNLVIIFHVIMPKTLTITQIETLAKIL